jgi:deoxyribonuclease V
VKTGGDFRIRGVSPAEGIEIQQRLRRLVSRRWDGRNVGLIAGLDVHFPTRERVRAAAAILTYPDLEIIERKSHEEACVFPYVPGLLSFREIPPILSLWKKIKRKPHLVLCDGQGIAHPRGLGLASHLGLILEIPTIGCAKSPLYGRFDEPGRSKGERSPIVAPGGGTIGSVLRTRDGTRPLYVSIGHGISLARAVRFVLSCTPKYRIPEPLRAAHRLAGGHVA